jgi:predicted cobalt transporter CbtA
MPPIVTSNAVIMCAHGGQVTLIPKQTQVMIQGGAVLCEPDLVGAPIVGCAQPPSPSTKPCTMVVSTLPGSTSLKVIVGGRPAYVATLNGLTDGVPPGALIVTSPGQMTVQG